MLYSVTIQNVNAFWILRKLYFPYNKHKIHVYIVHTKYKKHMIENRVHFGNMCTYNPFQGYIVELGGGWVGCSPVSMKFGKT